MFTGTRISCFVLCFAAFLATAHSMKLPSYIPPCKAEDISIMRKCVIKNANVAIPRIVKGDPEYGFPVMDPLTIDETIHYDSELFAARFSDLLVHGMENVKMVDAHQDLIKMTLNGTLHVDRLVMDTKFTLYTSGRKKQVATGIGLVEYNNVHMRIIIKHGISKRDRLSYFVLMDQKTETTFEKATFKVISAKGDTEFAKHLEASPEDMMKALVVAVNDAFNDACTTIGKNMFFKVPISEIFI